jgi:hypothetical protein
VRPRSDTRRRRQSRLGLEDEVGLRHDPHRSAFGIHDGKGADVLLRKQTLYLLEVSTLRDRDRITRHDIAHSKAHRAPDASTRFTSHCAPCISTA